MTTREEMATQFACAMMGNPRIAEALIEAKMQMTDMQAVHFDTKILPQSTARAAVDYADALLKALAQ